MRLRLLGQLIQRRRSAAGEPLQHEQLCRAEPHLFFRGARGDTLRAKDLPKGVQHIFNISHWSGTTEVGTRHSRAQTYFIGTGLANEPSKFQFRYAFSDLAIELR